MHCRSGEAILLLQPLLSPTIASSSSAPRDNSSRLYYRPSINKRTSETPCFVKANTTMYSIILLSLLLSTITAAPVSDTIQIRATANSTWHPAEGTKTSCDKTSDKIIGFYVGPQMESVLTDACVAMMPPCAHPGRLADDIVCAQVTDWRLDGPKNSTQSANVETAEGNKISGWDVKRKLLLREVVIKDVLTICSLSQPYYATRDFGRCLLDCTGLLWVFRVHAGEVGTRRMPHTARLWYW